jgi:hypothetical protein
LLPPLVFAEKHSRQTRSAAGYRCCAHLLKFEARGCQSIDLQAAGREMRHNALAASRNMEAMMNEDVFNVSIRKFLKTLGVSAQREIEKAVRQALAEGKLKGNERLQAVAVVTLGGIGLSHEIKAEIELE